jgi:AcrR family transcriptional regulator
VTAISTLRRAGGTSIDYKQTIVYITIFSQIAGGKSRVPSARATKERARLSGPVSVRGRRPTSAEASESPSVRDRILHEAERLFAEHGMSGVGLRAITAAAKVNLASIAYHFGSKEGLLETLFAMRAAPIAEARVRMLEEAEAAANGSPRLEAILDAFIRPALTIASQSPRGGQAFGRLRARLAAEPERIARKFLSKAFDESSLRFLEAIVRALPDIPRAEVEWRFHFMLGTMFYTMADNGRIQALTGGRCDPGNVNLALEHMIPYLAAGFRSAPVPNSFPTES